MLSTMNQGDTAWMLACGVLAFLAIAGFIFFYGNLCAKKNPLSVVLPCLIALGLVGLQWILFGYSLSFGPDHNGWIGKLTRVALYGLGTDPNMEYAGTIPPLTFVFYNGMLACAAVTIFLCAYAERMRLIAICLLAFLWTTLVYDPIAHWIWNVGGFLRRSEVLDFAGGAVVHVNAGVSSLAAALILNSEYDSSSSHSSNLLFTILGGLFIWLGSFGLHAGSALSASATSANAILVTHVSAIAGSLVWAFLDRIVAKEVNLLGFLTGAIAGIVGVTASAGSLGVWGALAAGIGASLLSYGVLVLMEKKTRFTDFPFIFCIHGMSGLWGMILAGRFLVQSKAVLAIAIYSFAMTYLLLRLIDYLVGLSD